MKFFLTIIFLLCISRSVLGQWTEDEVIQDDSELSYQELINMNVSCFPSDSCAENRMDDLPVPAFGDKCSCHSQCWEYGTCCIDSPCRVKTPSQACRRVGEFDSFYMVSRCPDNTDPHSIWKYYCEREWNERDDILMISPITSLGTSLTYKNYYCFRCHETTDRYLSWNLAINSPYTYPIEGNAFSVTYNLTRRSWIVILDKNNISIPVQVSFQIPHNLQTQPISCDFKMFADCPPTWKNRRVREKCRAYTALIYYGVLLYKNAHCFICNTNTFHNEYVCDGLVAYGIKADRPIRNLLDITNDKVGNNEKCEKEQIWDPYAKRCRKLKCNIPGYVIKNGRCVLS